MNWRTESTEALLSELDGLVQSIHPDLPNPSDYGLPDDSTEALREVEQLIAGALNPNDHGERANLLYLKARFLELADERVDAMLAGRACESEATRAFFGSSNHTLWLELHLRRIKMLGQGRQWLAFERALSQMIGWLAPSSRARQDYNLTTAYYARGLVLQLRGLECDDPRMANILLSAGLRDLEKTNNSERTEQAIDQAKWRITFLQAEHREYEAATSNSSVATIGLANFEDLPEEARNLFLNGANRNTRARFFAEQRLYGIFFELSIFLFLSFVLALGSRQIFGGSSFVASLALIPAVLMVVSTVRIIRKLAAYSREKAIGGLAYGLLIDKEKFAVRTLAAFSGYTYFYGKNGVLLPLERIRSISIGGKPTYAMSGRMRHADVLILRYVDEREELQRIDIPDRFELPVTKIRDLLLTLNHDLVGDWKDSRSNATLRFDQESGMFADYDGKEIRFRWCEVEGGALEVWTFKDDGSRDKAFLHHFEIVARGSLFELIFFEGCCGSSIRQFTRTSPATETAVDPARVAKRIAASSPLAELVP